MAGIFSPIYGSGVSVPRRELRTTYRARPATLTAGPARRNPSVAHIGEPFRRGNLESFTECRRGIRHCATAPRSRPPCSPLQLGRNQQ